MNRSVVGKFSLELSTFSFRNIPGIGSFPIGMDLNESLTGLNTLILKTVQCFQILEKVSRGFSGFLKILFRFMEIPKNLMEFLRILQDLGAITLGLKRVHVFL